jgi:hypothetical protein
MPGIPRPGAGPASRTATFGQANGYLTALKTTDER